MISVCKKCGYPDTHPLGLIIDSDGICSGCHTHDEKYHIDWNNKRLELKSLVSDYRSANQENYDCIVPINGGTDSYYTLYYVTQVLKMRPLCVVYNSLYMTRLGHRNLSNLRVQFNVDIHIYTPSIEQIRELNKATLYLFNSMYWHVHAGSTSFPVQIALKYKVPLIIWGGHEGVEQVGMFSHNDNVEMSARYRENHHLLGYTIADIEKEFPSLKKHNNYVFYYPDYDDLNSLGVRGIYLSNYIPWNQKLQHEYVAKTFGYKAALTSNSLLNMYEHPHCAFYNGIHDWIKFLKHGYGRLLDHLVRDIRWSRITTAQACSVIKGSQSKPPIRNIKMFRDFMDFSANGISYLLDDAQSSTFFPASNSKYSSIIYSQISCLLEGNESNPDYSADKLRSLYQAVPIFNSSPVPHILLNGYPF